MLAVVEQLEGRWIYAIGYDVDGNRYLTNDCTGHFEGLLSSRNAFFTTKANGMGMGLLLFAQ